VVGGVGVGVQRGTAGVEQQPGHRPLLVEAEERIEGGPPTLLGRALGLQRRAQVGEQLLLLGGQKIPEQRQLGRKVVVEHGARDAGRGGDPADGGSLITDGRELGQGGFDDQLAALGAGDP
jgi:hypothetical protein